MSKPQSNHRRAYMKAYSKAYYLKHQEKLKERSSKYFAANKEAALEKCKERYKQNRDRVLAVQKEYAERNRDQRLAYLREWTRKNKPLKQEIDRAYYEANKEKIMARIREWQKANPETMRSVTRRRRARMKGATIERVTAADTRALFLAFPSCPYCGVALMEANRCLDHVVPLARGGVHALSNLIPCCRTCNAQKGDKLLSEWKK